MFLPIGDTPNPPRFKAWVNWALIATNVAAYAALTLPLSLQPVDASDPVLRQYLEFLAPHLGWGVDLHEVLASLSRYDLFTFVHGYKPGGPELVDLFASIFLHGSFWHLAGNMLFLWIFGDNVEHRLGRLGYLFTYLGCGVVATLSFGLVAEDPFTPLIGASGAISGVLGIYFLLFPHNRVKVFVFLFPIFLNVVLLPVRWVLGFYILVDNLLPILIGGSTGVAHGAHLGGFFGGMLIALIGERFSWRWPWRDPHWRVATGGRASAASSEAVEGVVGRLRRALENGQRTEALLLLPGLVASEVGQLGPDECVVLAQWLDESGHPVAAGNLLRRCLRNHVRDRGLARVYLTLGLFRLAQGQPTAAYQHLLSVFDHDPDPATEAEARSALQNIEVYRPRR